VWANARSEIVQNPTNKASLDAIEGGLIAICLDSVVTYHKDEFHKVLLSCYE